MNHVFISPCQAHYSTIMPHAIKPSPPKNVMGGGGVAERLGGVWSDLPRGPKINQYFGHRRVTQKYLR
jgi:hypothetical protein